MYSVLNSHLKPGKTTKTENAFISALQQLKISNENDDCDIWALPEQQSGANTLELFAKQRQSYQDNCVHLSSWEHKCP